MSDPTPLPDVCVTRKLAGQTIRFFSLEAFAREEGVSLDPLPPTIRILVESLLRQQDHPAFEPEHARQLLRWTPDTAETFEIPFLPARVLLQDFTGVPCVVDLAALRSELKRMGGDPGRIEPQVPVDLVIDHSVQLDEAGHSGALAANLKREYERNRERYAFLRWGRNAFHRLSVLPPGLGICHQVNMEYLAACVCEGPEEPGGPMWFPDSLVGTDSHTVMINSMGILGWGVGGIEAEAAMLGQPIPLLAPRVTGVRLCGLLDPRASSTDLALTVTERLRAVGVVGHLVEFFGPGLDGLSLADRAPVANMAPEYGATTGFFPVDEATLAYLRETGRPEPRVQRVEAYSRMQGLWRDPQSPVPAYSQVVDIDLGEVRPSVSGPSRPQQRTDLGQVGERFDAALTGPADRQGFAVAPERASDEADLGPLGRIGHGAVLIASITSCTNTSNPALILAAAILAGKARRRGLRVPPWVKTSFAPGSRAVTAYLRRSGRMADLEALGFHVSAYGCATCIGNSGPLSPEIEEAVREHGLIAAAVLSGNRNFEGRIHPLTKANYLCSPALVLAYALRGTVQGDIEQDELGRDADGVPVYLRDLWPDPDELEAAVQAAVSPEAYRSAYARLTDAGPEWEALPDIQSPVFAWESGSTYVREPPFVRDLPADPGTLPDLEDAVVLGFFGDFITTDHISPAGAIPPDSPAAEYLRRAGVAEEDFNSYGSRRGNHEVMMRGTFGNIRLRNRLVDREGGWTRLQPGGRVIPFFDAAEACREEAVPLLVLAGKMYGAGSSRDWAAKGPALLGVRAVLAESFERIHRSNLVGMGILPLEFLPGQSADVLGLTGAERFSIHDLSGLTPRSEVSVLARRPDGEERRFPARARVDSAVELAYLRHGGILPYVLRQMR